uniref:SecY-type transporter protein n=1 Tax=Eustigmatophyceae sp. Mont 10/10-1w TaxID=2506145 RepID=A0A451FMP1_9STRA|nr:SecY-type transporter protein [Eustigmatophyceae sp. Mont 10/10-1w]QAA11680.1 SecY-type transporter protein [Eustigmatophyceae sp. Mont 10/10-1w]
MKDLRSILRRYIFDPSELEKSSQKKLISLIFVGIGLRVLSRTPLPGIDYSLLPSSNQPGLLELGILPFIQASILAQLINLNDDDEFNKQTKIQKQIKYISVGIAIITAITKVKALAPAMYSYTFVSTCLLGITLITGALILIWVSEWISEVFSLSGSVVVLLLTSIIDDLFRLFSQARVANNEPFIIFIFYLILVSAFAIFFSRSTINFPIRSSRQAYSKQLQSSTISFTVNPGAVMALVSTESLIRLFLSNLGGLTFISKYALLFSGFINIVRFVLIVVFSYYSSKLQVDSDKVAKELNTMNVTILTKSSNETVKEYLDRILKKTYIGGGILLAALVALSEILGMYYPAINLRANLSSLMILFGTLHDLDDRVFGFSYSTSEKLQENNTKI